MNIDELPSCNLDGTTFWVHDWVPKRKFRGAMLSAASARNLDTEMDTDDILKRKVVHGWVITVDGGAGWCGEFDAVTYMVDTEPEVIDGTWGEKLAPAIGDDEEREEMVPALVIDGPHRATWMSST